MPVPDDAAAHKPSGADDALASFGPRLRRLRTERGIGLRAFARDLGVSPSAVSQMETGKIRPTMKRLHDIVALLGIGLEEVFAESKPVPAQPVSDRSALRSSRPNGSRDPGGPGAADRTDRTDGTVSALGALERGAYATAADHQRLLLEDGVEWYQISPVALPDLEMLRTVYPVGARVSTQSEFVRHAGWEMGYVLSGRMRVQLAFTTRDVGPGESICFSSSVPHKLSNPFDQEAVAIWVRSTREPDL